MKKFIDTLLLIMIILTGLSLFLYPTVSNYLSEQNGSQAIDGYTENVSVLDEGASAEELAKAERYNAALYRSSIDAEPTAVSQSDYDYMLNISGDGMIGYLDIPRISVRLPIYHGTGETTLEKGVGHLLGSSLPIGGSGCHCILTGHSGVAGNKLFSDIDQKGMDISVHKFEGAVKRNFAPLSSSSSCQSFYEVESVTVVVPDETEALRIRRGEDLCTLVTCTPYGLNTHRLLVTGHRVENAEPARSSLSDSYVDALMNNPIMIALAALLIMLMITYAVTKLKRD